MILPNRSLEFMPEGWWAGLLCIVGVESQDGIEHADWELLEPEAAWLRIYVTRLN